VNRYIEKQALFPEFISDQPDIDLFNVIVIPCFNEPDILTTLDSLKNCLKPTAGVEVLIVINASEDSKDETLSQNKKSSEAIHHFKLVNTKLFFKVHVIVNNQLPKKHAGVGLARKIGMDEAVRRFMKLPEHAPNKSVGIITCLDADCTVNKEYLVAIEAHFHRKLSCPGVSIKYEHDLSKDSINNKEIADYELHLRYYNQGLMFAGFPYAFQTVGSAMSVRQIQYQKQGGMNRRKAGEDFYFLHKFTSMNHFDHLKDAIVFPSSRVSERVPFGTGRAMLKMKQEKDPFLTYDLEAFYNLKSVVDNIDLISDQILENDAFECFSDAINLYLNKETNYAQEWKEIKLNSTSKESFRKRFFVWMNAFWVMKYLNYHRNESGGKEVGEESLKLYQRISNTDKPFGKIDLLNAYRQLERE